MTQNKTLNNLDIDKEMTSTFLDEVKEDDEIPTSQKPDNSIVKNLTKEEREYIEEYGGEEETKVVTEVVGPVKPITLMEKIDIDCLRTIRDNIDFLYDNGYVSGRSFDEIQDNLTKQQLKTIVDKYYKTKMKGTNIKYTYSKGIKWGRMFSKGPSLQSLCKSIRHTICNGKFVDIDMKNAHCCILLMYCNEQKLDCPNLLNYVNNRDTLLKELCAFGLTRDEAKTFPLSIMNGGIRSGKFKTGECPEWLLKFEKEMKRIQKFYSNTTEGKKRLRRAKTRNPDNALGSCLNYYLCNKENEILNCLFNYYNSRNITTGALCFDGLMLYKHTIKDINLLVTQTNVFLEKVGYGLIKMDYKPMEHIIDFHDLGLEMKTDIDNTDEGQALYYYDERKDFMMYHKKKGSLFFYDEYKKLWDDTDFEIIRTDMSNVLQPYLNDIIDTEERMESLLSLKESRTKSGIIREIKPLIKRNYKDNFINTKFDKKVGFFPVKGGVIDLHNLEVREMRMDDYFTKGGERTYIAHMTEEQEDYVVNYIGEILDTTDRKYIDYLLSCVGYSLTGENNLKLFFTLLGCADSGKSLFLELLLLIFGDFGTIANEKCFTIGKKSTHDQEIFSLEGVRMSGISELSEDDKFNERLIKSISGGDVQNLRRCGSKNNEKVSFDTILWLMSNHLATFQDKAFITRIRLFDFHKKFKRDGKKKREVLSNVDLFFTMACNQANKYYNNGLQIEDVKQVLAFTDTNILEKDSFIQFFKEDLYEVTGDDTDRVKKTDLLKDYKNYVSRNFPSERVGRNKFYNRCIEVYDFSTYRQRWYEGVKKTDYEEIEELNPMMRLL